MKKIIGLLLAATITSCSDRSGELFVKLPSERTHIDFKNEVFESDSISLANHYYFYNGGGVSVADFNADGLQDIFFTGNHVSSKLYLNQGNLSFEDVTVQAQIANDAWNSGSTFVDINNDGRQDIYVCTVGENEPNQLFVNQGNNENGVPMFKEEAARYGLDDTRICTQAAFLDYDRDNDLDLFLIVNTQSMTDRNLTIPRNTEATANTIDILYRNNGDNTFTDISEEAGITNEGYSLGIAINDINNDGWPDIYVANDFITNDLLYINDQQGGFEEKATEYLRHTSYNGMGVDVADVNHDGLMDITVLDMLPESNRRRKLMQAPLSYDLFNYRTELGYAAQHVKNTLQVNQGTDSKGDFQFSELGTLTGMYSTDWSWAPLWGDYDNDGSLDLFITNGYYKDLTDMDFALGLKEKLRFGSNEHSIAYQQETLDKLNPIKKTNFLYRNKGDLDLENTTGAWGIEEPSFSHGAAFADLDNDGDLELVVNNLGQTAFLYKNNTMENASPNIGKGSYLNIDLEGPGNNTAAIGARLKLFSGGKLISDHYHSYVRGYLSSMGETIHIGLPDTVTPDSLWIQWPDGSYQKEGPLAPNSLHKIVYGPNRTGMPGISSGRLFTNLTDSLDLAFLHEENSYIDFKNDPLFYKMYSREGPGISIGDLDGDGKDDLLVGGAADRAATQFIQKADGTFEKKEFPHLDTTYEDMGMLLFDADDDGDNDLYVVSGGSDFGKNPTAYRDRFYRNENGHFEPQDSAVCMASGGPVKGADFDRDGDIDLFVGGKIRPGEYPRSPRSSLLVNEHGAFVDATPEGMQEIGMISDALWTDFDDDGWVDLIAVGEFTQIQIFINEKGSLRPHQVSGLEHSSGWWNSITGGDFDKDGDTDYIVGGFGSNSYIKADPEHPVRVYADDFDKNGKIDPIFSYYEKDDDGELKEAVLHTRDALISQVVAYKRRFKNFKSFSEASFNDILRERDLRNEFVLTAEILTSMYLENLGENGFRLRTLPKECQVAPVYGVLVADFDADGNLDAMLSGNQNSADPLFGNYDASNGVFLKGDGTGNLVPISTLETGLFLNEDQRSLAKMYVQGASVAVAAANQGGLNALVYHRKVSQTDTIIPLRTTDAGAYITFGNGQRMKMEFYYGNGYLSQSSRSLEILPDMQKVVLYDYDGTTRTIP